MGKNPCLPDLQTIINCGIDPRTKLPLKMGLSDPTQLKTNIKRALRIVDEQDAVNRGKWYNLPCNLSSQDLERMLYYKGQLCFFYNEELDEFYFLPFALTAKEGNGLDVYGRYNYVRPVAYNGGAEDEKKPYKATPIENYLSQLKLKVVYAPKLEVDYDDMINSAVILQDYTPQYKNTNIEPRSNVNDCILDAMAECIPFMRTNLIMGTGISGMRVNNGDEGAEVINGAEQMQAAALKGVPWIPITAPAEFQELGSGAKTENAEQYFLAMQSLDNLRLSLYGIDNGGLFEKKAHILQSEADVNGGPVGLVMQDAVTIRQNFGNIVNSIWVLGIWYEPSETITKADQNGDGVMYDRNDDSSNSGVESTSQNNGGVEDDL